MFEKYSDIKFHENPFRRTNRQTDMARLMVAIYNFAGTPKKDFLA